MIWDDGGDTGNKYNNLGEGIGVFQKTKLIESPFLYNFMGILIGCPSAILGDKKK